MEVGKIKLDAMAYGEGEGTLHVARYTNNRIGLSASQWSEVDHFDEPFCTFSVNLVTEPCPEDEVWIKDYSENEGAVDCLIANHIIQPFPTALSASGFVSFGRHAFTPEFRAKLVELNFIKE